MASDVVTSMSLLSATLYMGISQTATDIIAGPACRMETVEDLLFIDRESTVLRDDLTAQLWIMTGLFFTLFWVSGPAY